MFDADLLKIMCCPETHQELRLADASLIARLNDKIQQKLLKNRGGQIIAEKLDAGLIRADNKFIYPVRQNIPVMLIEDGIENLD